MGNGEWRFLPIDNVVICSAVVVVVVAAACFTSWMGLGLWTRNSGTAALCCQPNATPPFRGRHFNCLKLMIIKPICIFVLSECALLLLAK